MKISMLLLVCMCCLIVTPGVWGQAADRQAHHGVLGYFDPQTGAFRALPLAVDETAEPPTLTTFTGTINLTITVTIKSAGIVNVVCTASTFVQDAISTGVPRIFDETDTVIATGTGSPKTCKLSIPYSWGLATQSTDSMSTSYFVTGAGTSTGNLPNRTSSLSALDTRKVPSSGTITSLTANVTI